MSPQQQQVFQSQQYRPLPHAQLALRIAGSFNRQRLKMAVQKVIEQDTVFRTVYVKLPGTEWPVQIVNDTAGFIYEEHNTDGTPNAQQLLLTTASQQVFDLEQGPLIRIDVAAASQNTTIIAVTIPAICADYCSVSILADQLILGYLTVGQEHLSADTDVLPYLQFSEWQHQLQDAEEKVEGLAYWNNKAAEKQLPLLPFDRDPQQQEGYVQATYQVTIPLRTQLAAFDQERLEAAMGLCWHWMLWRFSGCQEAVTGHINTGRDFAELNQTLGLLSRCLPVAISLTPVTPFHASLNAYISILQANDEHKVYYMPHGNPSPLPYIFEYQDMPLRFRGMSVADADTIEILQRQASPEATKIQLRCVREADEWRLVFCYNQRAFSEKSIQLLASMYICILEQCLGNPAVTPSSMQLLGDDELQLIMQQFNDVQTIFEDGDLTIDELFDKQAGLYGQAPVVTAGSTTLTYADLQAKVNALAAYLVNEKKIMPGSLVALMCEEREHMVIGILAILKAGAAYVPLDPANPEKRLRFVLEDSNAALLLTQRSLVHHAAGYTGDMLYLEDASWQQSGLTVLNGKRTPESIAYVIYTSGTTGKPKGVQITDRSLVNYVCWLKSTFGLEEQDSGVLLSSFAFDLGYTSIWGTLLTGGHLHLVPESMVKQPDALVQYIAAQGITFIKTTPSLFHVITHASNAQLLAGSKLRLVLTGGEPIRVRDLEEIVRIKPDIALANHYGPTETTIGTVATLIDTRQLQAYAVQPVIGRPVANSYIYILDEQGHSVPPGIAGELCVAGVGLAKGYLNRDVLTAEKFAVHPSTGQRIYRTGDQAYWTAEGNILFTGRIDDQVKIRGYRVELNEVQSALALYPAVRRVAVIAIDNEAFGKELAAYYESNGSPAAQDLRSFLSASLPEAFIPSYFIQVKELPLTANGKLNKAVLPPVQLIDDSAYVAPRNETEAQMAVLWQTLLGNPRIGVDDDFFDMGGHSLKAIQLATHIHKQFNVKIEISRIFAHPTIAQLAVLVQNAITQQFQHIIPLEARGLYELSHAQKRLWIMSQFEDGAAAYNVPSATLLEGPVDTVAFRCALETLVERHENLRTVFVTKDGHPMQLILPADASGFVMQEKDLRSINNAAELVKEWMATDTCTPFDLEKGPLLRAMLLRLEEEQYLFMFNIHHIVSDGWSRGLLARELLYFYRLYEAGEGQPLPPLRLQYKDYAAWHNGIYEMHAAYWQQLYKHHIPSLDFPADFERPAVLSFSGAYIQRTLSADSTMHLKKMAQAHNTTLNNLLFALYGMLLAHYTGKEEVVLGSLVSGRSHVDLENMLGVFINFLPIRLKTDMGTRLEDYVRETHAVLMQAYQHQDYPFDLMVEHCIHERDMSHNPFFDTMVNFHSESGMSGQGVTAGGTLDGTQVRIRPYLPGRQDEVHAVLDFKLDIHPVADTLELYFSYNSKLFTPARMETFLDRYVVLLESVLADPAKLLADYFSWNVSTAVAPVNICSTFVAEPLEEYMQYWSQELEMGLQINFAPYNQVFQQLYNTDSLLYNADGINVLLLRVEDWIRDVRDWSAEEQVTLLEQAAEELKKAFNYSREHMFVTCLVGLAPLSPAAGYAPEVAAALELANNTLLTFFANKTGCYLVDMEEAASLYAVEEVFDTRSDEVGHIPFSTEYYAALGTLLARKVRACKATPYKVIVFDCDNTLWKGICGETDARGVEIDENFKELQRFLLKKYEEGFLLAIASKNNEADVWEVFDTHPDMVLNRSHIAAHRINWEHKALNIGSLARELNLSADSFIFLDDSMFEIEQVSAAYPDLLALPLPGDAAGIPGFLYHNWAFDRLHITAEDRERNNMYKAEKERKSAQEESRSIAAFMQSMNIRVYMDPLAEVDVERAVQLTLRTNQFNLNGKQLSSAGVLEYMKDNNGIQRIIKVEDRFGNYGTVGLLLAGAHNGRLLIDTWLLSCRVLGRGVEDIVLEHLQAYAAANGLYTLEADFIPTAKNKPFSQFLERTGWEPIPGSHTLSLPVDAKQTVC
ncbi:hypothetical protein BW716_20680 [[Flexibacter] sp. ATCC 35208]|nr:hypothetical protein BW716_20680 [[Flexibacter] sp. ATCC 35208]